MSAPAPLPPCKLDGRTTLVASVASLLLAMSGGCCAGRIVSVQLYEDPSTASHGANGGGLGCKTGLGSRVAGLRRHHGSQIADDEALEFRGPAFGTPLPRFHPVPVRPVFEPREEFAVLPLLQGMPAPADDSSQRGEPTPAPPPSASKL